MIRNPVSATVKRVIRFWVRDAGATPMVGSIAFKLTGGSA
jgi:hypothetical protein